MCSYPLIKELHSADEMPFAAVPKETGPTKYSFSQISNFCTFPQLSLSYLHIITHIHVIYESEPEIRT
jgi:hypothetical protein